MTVPQEVFANDTATGTLASDPTTGTTLTLTTGHGARFPTITSGTDQFRVRVESEIMIVTAHGASADTMTVSRGAEGTSNVAHPTALTPVDAVLTADALERHMPDYLHQPRHNGLLGWVCQPGLWISAAAQTAGVVYVSKMFTPEPSVTFANMYSSISTAGITGTATWFLGIYNQSGTLIGKTADQGATTTSAAVKGPYALTVEGGQSLTWTGGPGTYVWLASLCGTQNSGTPWAISAGAGGNTGRGNVGITSPSASIMFGSVLTGQATFPSSITPANIAIGPMMAIAVS